MSAEPLREEPARSAPSHGPREASLPDSHHWEAIARSWQTAHPQRLWRAHSDAVNEALFARWLPETSVSRLLKTDVFDEAVSHGLYPLLAARARTVVGIDIAFLTLRSAQSRCPGLRATRGDVRLLPFADASFDVVVSNSTLDHFDSLDDVRVSLRELHRVLRGGGRLLLTMDNPVNPMIALRNALPRRPLQRVGLVPYYVGVTCSPSRLTRLLSEIGFEIRRVDAVVHCWRVLAVPLARLAERWGSVAMQRRYLRLLLGCERLSTWPTRFLTGHYVAVHAGKSDPARSRPSADRDDE